MRVLYFTRDYTTHDRRFLQKLAESRHEVFFLRLENDGIEYEKRPLPRKVREVDWPGGKRPAKGVEDWIGLMTEFESVLQRVQPDLVHAGPVQSCGFMSALSGFHPFLVMSWGSDILVDADLNEMSRWITRYTLNNSDMLLCDCQPVLGRVQQLVQYADSCVVQFPWGIEMNVFRPGEGVAELRNSPNWEDSFIILSTRSWEAIYGIDVLLEAFRQAHSVEPALRLVLVGDGSLVANTENLIMKYGLEEYVYRPGRVSHDKLPGYFRDVDLYVSCATSDGTSISLLEAMYSHLPVVVTDNPGNREWVVHGDNGWLGTAGDPASFAELFLKVVALRTCERESIGLTNRQIVEERANWSVNFTKLLDAYDLIEDRFGLKGTFLPVEGG